MCLYVQKMQFGQMKNAPEKYGTLEKVTRFTGFAGGKAIHLTSRLQSSSLFADSTWPF